MKHQRHYDVFLYKSDLTSKLLACSVYLDQHASETGDNTEAEARQRLFFFLFYDFMTLQRGQTRAGRHAENTEALAEWRRTEKDTYVV